MKSRLILPANPSGLLAFMLSALLAVQVAVAFLPVEAVNDDGASGFSIVICSDGGTRTISMPANDDDADGTPMPNGHCPLCIVSAAVLDCGLEPVDASRIISTLRYGYTPSPQTRGQHGDWLDAIRAPPFG
ncbi:DUF2946 family protein [Roseovarius sp. ZX-A-9]|uniref:DUF2946 family protein n=1 Tax=Roseovarius sp. ZX-A-9 TaxID=3014783 RepID=UPI00232B361D|nr:DUF2946 family protein [Roseovarius sp. ZX-A-9]